MLRRLISALILLSVPIALVLAFYLYAAGAAERVVVQHGLPAEADNAVKHAYAAAETYTLLRPLIGRENAGDLTDWFGRLNEHAEPFVKHSVDWATEAYKDMRNNLAGIVAAEWLYDELGWTRPSRRLHLVGLIAREGLLTNLDSDLRIPSLPHWPDGEAAMAAIMRDGPGLRAHFRAELETRREMILGEIAGL